MTVMMKARTWAAAAACAALAPALAHASAPSARVVPAQVAPGEAATLIVTTDESGMTPEIPSVSGLQVQPIGRQTQQTMTNGLLESSTSYLYSVSSDHPGDLAIDGISVGGERAPAVTLHVGGPARARPSSPGASGGSPFAASPFAGFPPFASGSPFGVPAPSAPARQSDAEPAEDAAPRASLRLRVDKQKLYAGESVPFTVQAYFRAGTGVTITRPPAFTSDAFVVSGLDEDPKQTETSIGGEPYLAVTWRGVLTAAKPGEHALELTLPASLQYRERAAGSAAPRRTLRDLLGSAMPFGSLLQDPMLEAMLDQSMFEGLAEPGRLVSRDVTLRDSVRRIRVQDLPETGKPQDFGGAIGQFEISASLPGQRLTQGEPVDVQLAIQGQGNFGRFRFEGLPSSEDFRSYAPKSEVSGGEPPELRGKLGAVQPIAARRAGALELPSVRFSYFDPATGRYVTKVTAPIPVQVAPAAGPTLAAEERDASAARAGSEAEQDALSVRSLTHGGVPEWLWPASLSSLLLIVVGAALLVARRSDPYQRAAAALASRRAVRLHRVAMRRAAERDDPHAFLREGRSAVQQRLGAAWQVRPDSISVSELEARWPSAPASIRRLFELADRADYGGTAARTVDREGLTRWASQLDREIADMEVPS